MKWSGKSRPCVYRAGGSANGDRCRANFLPTHPKSVCCAIHQLAWRKLTQEQRRALVDAAKEPLCNSAKAPAPATVGIATAKGRENDSPNIE